MQREFSVKAYDGANTQKRRWAPKASWDRIKTFVLDEVTKGKTQKNIIEDLEGQGISIESYQLKRLLKEWGISDRNIRKKNRKYIFETEKRLKEQGKCVRTWRFKDTRQPVKQSQLAAIRRSTRKEFQGVEASPGALIVSPAELMEEDPPVGMSQIGFSSNDHVREDEDISEAQFEHGEVSQDTRIELGICVSNMEAFEPKTTEQSPVSSDDEIEFLEGFTSEPMPASPAVLGMLGIPTTSTVENKRSASKAEKNSRMTFSSQASAANNPREGVQSNAEIPIILESLCESFTSSIDTTQALVSQTRDSLRSQTLLSLLAPDGEPKGCLGIPFHSPFEEHVLTVAMQASEFRDGVDSLQQRFQSLTVSAPDSDGSQRGKTPDNSYFTLSKCEDIIRYQMSLDLAPCENVPVDYNMAFWMSGGPSQILGNIENNLRLSFVDEILQEFYTVIEPIWNAICSPAATMQNLEGQYTFRGFHKQQFRERVVKLPQLLQRYSLTSWSTFSTLQLFHEFCILWYGKSYWGRPILRDILKFLIGVLSTFKPSKGLLTCLVNLIAGLHHPHSEDQMVALNAAKYIFDKARKSLGDYEIFTIWVAAKIQLILREMNRQEEAQNFGKYTTHFLKKPSQSDLRIDFSELNLILSAEIIDFQIQQKAFPQAANYARLLDSKHILGAPEDDFHCLESLAGHCNRGNFDCLKARAFSEIEDYAGALTELQKSMRRLETRGAPYRSCNIWVISDCTQLTAEFLTKRGLVLYGQPVLKQLSQALEDRGFSNDHPLYKDILAAELAADFQMSLDEEDWAIPMIISQDLEPSLYILN
ncbi:hypothetical protein TWF788_000299 [Orbilia oligospora]|uniref:Clr5 domain-containing protein n=1 Tax=Orbilia oligospora TaxID=2813651 RepID=A0A7C8Q447_ORBOL|nr:hypothetical protein TWF788_000299 [Orbilia oligospora]